MHSKPTATPITPAPEPRKRVLSDASRAAALFNRLAQLDADERAELAASPADIARKYQERRRRALDDVGEGVVELVKRMRGEA